MLHSIPIQVNEYPGLLIADGFVHVLSNETAFATQNMTEEMFLRLISISSVNELQQYQKEHLEQRFIVAESGFVIQEKYFTKAFQELELIKATGGLWALHEAFLEQDTYNRELAVYLNSHECLQEILGSDVLRGADEYMYLVGNRNSQYDEDDSMNERYPSAAGFHRSLSDALDTLQYKLEKKYMSAEPCLTVIEAMWEYAYFRYKQEVRFKKCEKPGCEKYFAFGPGGQRSRKYCAVHSR